jgi:rifampicin phosphotransferase
MTDILKFDDDGSTTHALVGGKGAHLGRLTQAGFPVPTGFSITTAAYSEFLSVNGLDKELATRVKDLAYEDAQKLQEQTTAIQDLITGAAIPKGMAEAIGSAYAAMGDDTFVAVRSSGTAEDLAEASFAGLHDTYLDVKGEKGLLKAVKDCWASLWTARATAYRHNYGFDHAEALLCVVVQQMVDAEASGVMFTAHPFTAETDRIVINASWGLGEAVVQGIITPDEYVVKAGTLEVVERTIGSKALRIVRDQETGSGTITEDVPDAERSRATLTDDEAVELAELGRRVEAYYDGFPQDTEWALADGSFYLLQSRPITGVEFAWEADINDEGIPVPDDTVWTRAVADEWNTGVLTPMYYTVRWLQSIDTGFRNMARSCGLDDLAKSRAFLYHRGAVYFNANRERSWIEKTSLPFLRSNEALGLVPPRWREDVMASPLRWSDYLKMIAQIAVGDSKAMKTVKLLEEWRANRHIVEGKTKEELRHLSDAELQRYVMRHQEYELQWSDDCCISLMLFYRDLGSLLMWICKNWYDGPSTSVFVDLLSGARERTDTQVENLALWQLSEQIRSSARLSDLFETYENGDFFVAVTEAEDEDVKEFAEAYAEFLKVNGHRGHADRDLIYPRRCEDPGIDYRALRMFLNVENPTDPTENEGEVNQRREDAYDEVVANLRRKPLGFLRAEIFKLAFDHMHRLIVVRDNERYCPTDVNAMAVKRGVLEIARRLLERSLIDSERDIYMLGWNEAGELLSGNTSNLKLVKAKIAARTRDVDRFLNKEAMPPKFLQHGKPVDLDVVVDHGDGVFAATPTSRGVVTGKARVVLQLADIGRVQQGEILVTFSTDPGWTPVFLLISGIVTETGGMMSHASCLAREYGFPAVQLPGASQSIPDGATITINGETGLITILPDSDENADADEPSVDAVSA